MKPAFSLLVVHGDGSRISRFRFSRWIAYCGLGVTTTLVAAAVLLSDDYAFLRQQSGELAALRRGAGDRADLGRALHREIATVRREIADWKAVHARMWQTLRPGADPPTPMTGVGGPTPRLAADPWEELNLLAASVAEEGPRLRELEHAIHQTGQIVHALPLRWPVRGQVNSEFGRRPSPWTGKHEHHGGMDIGSWPGTPVEAPAPATVIAAGRGVEYGKYVTLDHGNGVTSRYGHLQKIDVKVGERVAKRQVIGRVGSTGRSTGPHLHYEVRVEGKPVNPRKFLWER